MDRPKREATIYFAVDGEEGYYIGSTERLKERQSEEEVISYKRGK